jgi:uncharacterized protein
MQMRCTLPALSRWSRICGRRAGWPAVRKAGPRPFRKRCPTCTARAPFSPPAPMWMPHGSGVAGFSFGGVMAMLAATRAYNDKFLSGAHFAALMPVYPACWTYNTLPGHEWRDLVDAPLLIVTGGLDQYDDDPSANEKLLVSLSPAERARTRTHVFADAHHCFDMPGVDVVVQDPMSHRGAGGDVTMRHNSQAAAQSHKLCADFFSETLI